MHPDDPPLPTPIPHPDPFDPKLKAAMEEIKATLSKFDIGGYVLLSSPTHNEYLFSLAPSWSCVRMEEKDGRAFIRLRTHEIPKQQKNKVLKDSVSLICGLRDSLHDGHIAMRNMTDLLAEHVEFKHVTVQRTPINRERLDERPT